MADRKKIMQADIELPGNVAKSLADGWNTISLGTIDDSDSELIVNTDIAQADKLKKLLEVVGDEISKDMSAYSQIVEDSDTFSCSVMSDNKKDATCLIYVGGEQYDSDKEYYGNIQIAMPEDKLNGFVKKISASFNELYGVSLLVEITEKKKEGISEDVREGKAEPSPFTDFYANSFAEWDPSYLYFVYNSDKKDLVVGCDDRTDALKTFDPLLDGAQKNDGLNSMYDAYRGHSTHKHIVWMDAVYEMRENAFRTGEAFTTEAVVAKKLELDREAEENIKNGNKNIKNMNEDKSASVQQTTLYNQLTKSQKGLVSAIKKWSAENHKKVWFDNTAPSVREAMNRYVKDAKAQGFVIKKSASKEEKHTNSYGQEM